MSLTQDTCSFTEREKQKILKKSSGPNEQITILAIRVSGALNIYSYDVD